MVSMIVAAWRRHQAAILVCIGSLLVFEYVWGARFYSSLTHVGHDFSGSALSLLEGKFWIDSNGLLPGLLNPPWFTPAWCSGSAFYADPQSLFYSPIQLFAFWVDPFAATHLSALLFALIGFWGSFAVARKAFAWPLHGSIVFAVLGMCNTFLPLRSAVGESGYQPLYLWTLLVLALAWPRGTSRRWVPWPSICVCLVLSAWLQFGFAGMMVVSFLGSLLLSFCLVIANKADLLTIIKRCSLGGVLAILLNGSKLYESISLLSVFSRNYYELPGFPSLADALLATAFALLQPSQWTADFGMRNLVHLRFAALPHEWAVSFGLGAFAVAIVSVFAGVVVARSSSGRQPIQFGWAPTKVIAAILATLIAAIPPLLMWSDGAARDLIKAIPILNSAAWPMRWIVVLLPLVQVLLAKPVVAMLDRFSPRVSATVLLFVISAIWCGPVFEPVGYYLHPAMQSYDPKPVRDAFNTSRETGAIPITAVAFDPHQPLLANRNDTMLRGASQSLCYNPNYGYRLEDLPQKEWLKAGAALSSKDNGQTLINHPACLLHPVHNACKPGDGFDLTQPSQRESAKRFLDRRPFDWGRPPIGHVLSLVSRITLIGLLFMFIAETAFWLARTLQARHARP